VLEKRRDTVTAAPRYHVHRGSIAMAAGAVLAIWEIHPEKKEDTWIASGPHFERVSPVHRLAY
jgi:hypothetical protein